MNIRSVDMQVLIPKATEVGKSQALLEHQSTLQQQYGAEKLQKTADHQLNQVQDTKKSEGGKVKREEARDKQRGSRQDRREQESREANGGEERQPDRNCQCGRFIDIKT